LVIELDESVRRYAFVLHTVHNTLLHHQVMIILYTAFALRQGSTSKRMYRSDGDDESYDHML
jgi:hypothetical protein